jgi:Domain of unknown function (DUF4153)
MTDVTDDHPSTGRATLNASGDRRATAIARLSIGLGQGIILWWLFQAQDGVKTWPATEPMLFWPLLLVFAYLPVVLLAGVGRLKLRTLMVWAAVAGATLALLAWHDIARQALEEGDREFTFVLLAFAAAALFIAHHLIVPADRERRLIAAFPTYFDAAWLAGVQLALSIGFAGVFWLLLFLGAALFNIIGLDFLMELIRQPFFSIPLTTVTFAVAVQLTDVRDGLIRGVRTVALMLLSWLLLVLTVLVAGFLIALPFTGLDGLWDTGSATALVLSAAAGLIILINTAYQDGRPDNLRGAVRVASVLLSPLIVIALWGLTLRIGQHGLTPDRIIAAACVLIGVAYAVGYGLAALAPFVRKTEWMRPLERTNIATAVLEVAVVLALFSPLADPARLSVADQVARLERGAVLPQTFDFEFLRWHSGRVGLAALDRLTRSDNAEIARLATAARAQVDRYAVDLLEEADTPFTIQAWPADQPLPSDFLASAPTTDPRRNCDKNTCLATQIDLDRDGTLDILLATRFQLTLFSRETGAWRHVGDYPVLRCEGGGLPDHRDLIRQGSLVPTPSRWPDLATGGTRASRLDPTQNCPSR